MSVHGSNLGNAENSFFITIMLEHSFSYYTQETEVPKRKKKVRSLLGLHGAMKFVTNVKSAVHDKYILDKVFLCSNL